MRDALTREVQSWLKYHAVKAAIRSQFAAEDVVRVRWLQCFQDNGPSIARLVIKGYHDPRIGCEVRTEVRQC